MLHENISYFCEIQNEFMKILVICTGNSCRSQMAEGFLKSIDRSLSVFSAGTHPALHVNPMAVKVMKELGIDIGHQQPSHIDEYLNQEWDFVITVCDHANESCPYFPGTVGHRLHIGFEDPADAAGTEEEILGVYRRVRDEIREGFQSFYHQYINPNFKVNGRR